jgi:hypothetical protein
MPLRFPQREIEEQIHKEFRDAFDELERASGQQRIDAVARLNRAVRKLFDFVGYGKMPMDLQSNVLTFPSIRLENSGSGAGPWSKETIKST